ncbi:MAG: ABC transporter permease [Deltaproteobacteria bacterium]|nr:ABC transporter permease [Deltaproteobacteria bacterium]MBW2044725.1 ABC transporter permease [Deltaproteobacteria bacterium]
MKMDRLAKYKATVTVYAILIGLIIIGGLVSESFFRERNIEAIIRGSAAVGIAAAGQTIVILAEGIDLSVGSVVSLTTCLTAGIINGKSDLVFPVVALVIFLALAIGFCNGFLVTKVGVNPIIVTLGMMAIIQGLCLLYADAPLGAVPDYFIFFAYGKIGVIPFPGIILGVIFAAGAFVLKNTKFGRYVYATGGNEEVARLSGIRAEWIKISTYMICSFCACLTGLYMVSRSGMGDPLIGEPFMFDSIIPVLLGGTAFSGGRGGVVGTLGGVFILMILNNLLNLCDVSTYWQWVIAGGIMLIAVVIYAKK